MSDKTLYPTNHLPCHFTDYSASTQSKEKRQGLHLKAYSPWIIQELNYGFFPPLVFLLSLSYFMYERIRYFLSVYSDFKCCIMKGDQWLMIRRDKKFNTLQWRKKRWCFWKRSLRKEISSIKDEAAHSHSTSWELRGCKQWCFYDF